MSVWEVGQLTAHGSRLTVGTGLGRPLRVMRVITRLNVGGPSYQAIFLTERLQGHEFECALLAGNVGANEGNMEALATERGVAWRRVPDLGRDASLRADVLSVSQLYRAMRQWQPDIVHTHLAKAGAVGRLAARMAGVPIVVHTYHGHVFHSYFSRRRTELYRRIERKLAQWTDRLVVLSESQEREFLGYGVGRSEQMVRIPLGLELEPFLRADAHRGRLRAELGIEASTPLVGIVARLVPIKAHALFLQAARRVALCRPDARFLIVGDGELRENLELHALEQGFTVFSHRPGQAPVQRDPASRVGSVSAVVHFLGFRSDLVTVYADLDVVVLCSNNEGLPVTLIEALAAARPVVATDVGAVRDLVVPGRTGLLVERGDVAGLAHGILTQIEEQSAALRVARAGRRHVYPALSIERLENDLRQLYIELAQKKEKGGRTVYKEAVRS